MSKINIAPSILTASFSNLEATIKELEEAGSDYLHLDVMDGVFVPQITFGAKVISDIKKISSIPLDAHLMIVNPEKHIDDFVKAGCDIISVHFEGNIHIHRLIYQIKAHNIKAGIVLNPHTRVDVIEPIIDDIDYLLIMSVNPGFGGQKFIESSVSKIKEAKKIIGNRDIILAVDGGVNLNTCNRVVDAGANFLVAGSAIIDSNNKKDTINKLRCGKL
ncbi:ribulose-phosphate 3-epimerase [Brachyspira hyodysenteriae]|uniref:ribulose-phosphate 3-epimerase n=1 Tax=Brachyspira hyodysenteriae TaxID=159 RepID=UPI00063DAD07|nr:ribulose-phosphate 3-epimerase [Brachyspira hyodysenteriae]KLI39799.1 ribulose-phosphate 3-epimerase [Brachyspira hyodysenteriae]KLI50685.1 ribulose-phosphate 3-epimerase [Brachyspira hyodysenteriae]KLI52677.1 ribulose-phosphate 3-epimerase [Brachyspira hyodysenteriae]KLI55674.1 ribulose-phosphate 3-epimerase [Brachyspira hyodysenteriae]MDA0055728.1 ribulose-phosphate 3-epimerase [Brachyspira hyodysenteriae]